MGVEKQDCLGDVNRGETNINFKSLFQGWGIWKTITGTEKSKIKKKEKEKQQQKREIKNIKSIQYLFPEASSEFESILA